MGFKKKDKFDDLSDEFKTAIDQASTDEIRKRISEVTILDLSMREVLKQDDAVQKAKEEFKTLMEPYREDFKSFKLQIQYAKQALDDKGGGATSAADKKSK